MNYILSFVCLAVLLSCKAKEDTGHKFGINKEQTLRHLIQSALDDGRQASEFKSDLWGGPFTFNRQAYLKNNPGHIFYSQIWNFDVAQSGGAIILSFIQKDYPQDSFIELVCTPDEISILKNESQEFLQDEYVALFTLDKITRTAASLESGTPDDQLPVFSETQAFIARGTLVKLLKLPK